MINSVSYFGSKVFQSNRKWFTSICKCDDKKILVYSPDKKRGINFCYENNCDYSKLINTIINNEYFDPIRIGYGEPLLRG